jgi:hypothetical protein
MPTASAPSPRIARISAGVSKDGPHGHEARLGRLADQGVEPREIDVIGQAHDLARGHARVQRPGGIGGDHRLGAQRLEHLQRQAHDVAAARLVIMGAAAEDGHALALELSDHQLRHMARHARRGKALELVIGDRDAIDRARQMAQPRAQDQPQPHRRVARDLADGRGEVLSVP